MIEASWLGQMSKSEEPGECKRCLEPSRVGYLYCALCCIKEDLGEWTRTTWKGDMIVWE